MAIERFFIGTRTEEGRYGPQSKSMQVSEFISLLQPRHGETRYILPDFSGLAKHIDSELRKHFEQQNEDLYYREYRNLVDIWDQAGSLSDPDNRKSRFEKVMDKSLEFLNLSHDNMPEINLICLKEYDGQSEKMVFKKAQMYCVALLFHIIARAAFEYKTTAVDKTLINHCRWMKEWIKKSAGTDFLEKMMLNTALFSPSNFPALQRLSGDIEGRDVQEYLADHTRECLNKSEHENNFSFEFSFEFVFWKFNKTQSSMLKMLIDIHYRIDRLELLIHELGEKTVDFDKASEAGKWIDEQVEKLEMNANQLPVPTE
ncbi:hypothetical protein ACQSMR_000912 [Morganella morganii]